MRKKERKKEGKRERERRKERKKEKEWASQKEEEDFFLTRVLS